MGNEGDFYKDLYCFGCHHENQFYQLGTKQGIVWKDTYFATRGIRNGI